MAAEPGENIEMKPVKSEGTEETKGGEPSKEEKKSFLSQASSSFMGEKKPAIDKDVYHYRNSLRNQEEIDSINAERQNSLGITPKDKRVIAGCFIILWSFMAFLFIACWFLNTLAKTSETLWAFFGCMIATFVAIGLSIVAGTQAKEQDERVKKLKKDIEEQGGVVVSGYLVTQGKAEI